jgi:hypothetical protein
MRHDLINDYNVSSSVGATNIKVGYQKILNEYPCITLFRIGETSTGRLGYQTSDGGSRDRESSVMMQVDIFHPTSVEQLEILDDYVKVAIMSGASVELGVRLLSNSSYWDDTYNSYRTTQTWLCNQIVQD